MKVQRNQNHTEKAIVELQRGDVFIDPTTDDVMLMTDMPTGDENYVFAVSLRWGSMQEYKDNEIVWACAAEVNVTME